MSYRKRSLQILTCGCALCWARLGLDCCVARRWMCRLVYPTLFFLIASLAPGFTATREDLLRHTDLWAAPSVLEYRTLGE